MIQPRCQRAASCAIFLHHGVQERGLLAEHRGRRGDVVFGCPGKAKFHSSSEGSGHVCGGIGGICGIDGLAR